MTKKRKLRLLTAFLVVLIIINTLSVVFSNDESISKIFNLIWIFLISAATIFMCAVFFLSRKRDAKLFQSYVNQKDYLTAKNVFQEKHKNYLLGGLRIIVDYYTLISCFALNDIDDARTLLIETRWGFFHRQIKYFEVLLNLKDNDLESARRNADILVGNPPKGSLNQINKMKQIFVCIDNDNFEDKFYLDSAYPIVKEIYDFYLSKKVGQ